MENIIVEILEIERLAKDKLERAVFEGNKTVAEAKEKKSKITREKIMETEQKLARIKEDEKEKTKQKLAQTENLRQAEIKRLDELFEKNSDKWAEEIFLKIINELD